MRRRVTAADGKGTIGSMLTKLSKEPAAQPALRKVTRIGADRARFEREVKKLVRLPDITQAILVVARRGHGVRFTSLNSEQQLSRILSILEIAKLDMTHRVLRQWDAEDERVR